MKQVKLLTLISSALSSFQAHISICNITVYSFITALKCKNMENFSKFMAENKKDDTVG